ncbi:hypothetical protein GCM10011514_10740 [Emticicia aquatilis]|uniref:DUF4138 domain-containing protein n=1 Tax=Emticicia aquatilis TaxID=1537369 RepID=A0A917DLR6_9BACT|nr:DUF4138 domain-containing protein [Emticicia aquatilis]GGD48520.1 hypothetical protein GCM10011514_10740 [Emticicia aquatilis]
MKKLLRAAFRRESSLWTAFRFSLLFISFAIFSQKKIDTIYVNATSTTYLIFDDAITLVNLGNTDYQAQPASTNQSSVATQVLFLKAKNTSAKPTTLLLTHGNQIYEAYLNYQEPLSKAFYDYRGLEKRVETLKIKDDNMLLNDKFKKLASLSPNILFKGYQSGIAVKCENLHNDENGTYLKFLVKNESSITYEIDNVSFSYISKMKKKAINRLQSLGIEEVNALKSIEPTKTISPQKQITYLYYVPLYATTDNGYLQVIFREKNGLRNVSIDIPFKKILKAEML